MDYNNTIDFIELPPYNKAYYYVKSKNNYLNVALTTYMKNFVNISDNCTDVYVPILGDAFIHEYNHLLNHNKLVTNFKNATFHYQIVDDQLTNYL